jgi:hypothetical protein
VRKLILWAWGLHFIVEALLLALVAGAASHSPSKPLRLLTPTHDHPYIAQYRRDVAEMDSIASYVNGRQDIARAVFGYRGKLPWRLVVGVILTENPWLKADTTNWYGAQGLMQVVGWLWGESFPECYQDLTTVEGNICHGTGVLLHYLRVTGGDVPSALALYSGGATRYSLNVHERGEI